MIADAEHPITRFRGDYGFLSNMYGGAENLYQARKVILAGDASRIMSLSPAEAKAFAHELRKTPGGIRPDWQAYRVNAMMDVHRIKFGNEALREKLLATGGRRLIEGNFHGDRFWGVCGNIGKNVQGRLLMALRRELGGEGDPDSQGATVLLTSFEKARQEETIYPAFSVARNQPSGFALPALPFLAAVGPNGENLGDLRHDRVAFLMLYREGLQARWGDVKAWLDALPKEHGVTLCCWCPHSEHSKHDHATTGSFFCHSGLIGMLINRHRPDVRVVLDAERSGGGLAEECRPTTFTETINTDPTQFSLF